jgi:hypothetical protein
MLGFQGGDNPLGLNFAGMMNPAGAAAPAAQTPATNQEALDAKAMQTILGMFGQANNAAIAEMNAMRPQLMQAPGGAGPQAAHTVPAPGMLSVPQVRTQVPMTLAQILGRR